MTAENNCKIHVRGNNGERFEPCAEFLMQDKEVPNFCVRVISHTGTFLISYLISTDLSSFWLSIL